jgi:hypothetical protein
MTKAKKWLGQALRQALQALPLCLFFALTLTLFAATQMVCDNQEEFWFTWAQMAPGVVRVGLWVWGALTLLLAVLPRRAFPWGQGVLLGLGVAALLQGNGLNADYGALNGQAIVWEDYTVYGLINTALWAGILFICLSLRQWKRFGVLCVVLPCLLAVGEGGWIAYRAAQAPTPQTETYLSQAGLYTVGTEENLLVLVLDSVDADQFAQALAEDPDLSRRLEGFTWYRNAMGLSDPTKYGLPALLTGQAYTQPVDYAGFIAAAYADAPLYTMLAGDVWDARFFTDSRYVSLDAGVVDNLAQEELTVNDPAGLTRDLLRLCAFRYAPHFLKPQLWMYSNVFLPYAQAQGEPVYEVTDPAFDARLREEGLEATVERAFRLIHLTGMHPPYTMDADCQYQAQGVTAQEQMRGCLRLAEDYLEQLRALGVYDRSAVLILADHGTETVHRPLLLLKRPGDTGEMAVNDAPVSYADLPATYVALLTGAQAGTELWSIPQGQARTRLYYHESSRNNAFNLYEYSTQALSPSWEELIPTGRVFHGDSLEAAAPYTLGETLYFDLRATARPYLVSGFSSADFHSTWTVGESGRISLPLAQLPRSDTLTVEMKFLSIMGGSQRLRVDCGGQTVFEGTVTDYTLRFSFPASLVQDQTLTLDFTYPDAISHLEAGLSEDTRQVAFAVTELTVLDGV